MASLKSLDSMIIGDKTSIELSIDLEYTLFDIMGDNVSKNKISIISKDIENQQFNTIAEFRKNKIDLKQYIEKGSYDIRIDLSGHISKKDFHSSTLIDDIISRSSSTIVKYLVMGDVSNINIFSYLFYDLILVYLRNTFSLPRNSKFIIIALTNIDVIVLEFSESSYMWFKLQSDRFRKLEILET